MAAVRSAHLKKNSPRKAVPPTKPLRSTVAIPATPAEKGRTRKPTTRTPPPISSHTVVQTYYRWQKAVKEAEEIEREYQEAYETYLRETMFGSDARILGEKVGNPGKTPVQKAAPTKYAPKVLPDEILDPDRTAKLGIMELRALAARLNLDEQRIKSQIMAELEAKGYFRESAGAEDPEDDEDFEGSAEEDDEDGTGEQGGDDEEDEDDDVEDDEDEEEESEEEEGEPWTREELEALSLKELKKVILDDESYGPEDVKGKDTEALIDMILGDEEEGDEEDEEEPEEEEQYMDLDPKAMKKMTPKALLELAKQLNLNPPAKIRTDSAALNKYIMANVEYVETGE